MGIKRSQVQTTHKASITLVDGEPTLDITFRSSSLRKLAELKQLGRSLQAGDEDALQSVADFLCTQGLGWNVEDEDGSPVPVTVENILDLDARIVLEIMGVVSNATNPVPKATTSESSDDGSSTPS